MSDGEGKLIQIGEIRAAKQDDLRREYERILFGRILGCYTIAQTTGMKAVEIVDISKSGISFKMDPKGSFYNVGEEVDLRLYFSAKSYLPIKVKVKRASQLEDSDKMWLYGCTLDTTLKAHKVIETLVDFIAAYSEQAKQDDGTSSILRF
ncbi:MAG: PilZ domain-containing protein [Bdellovibrionota bacterium]